MKKSKKPKIYISYCDEDVNEKKLNYFVQKIIDFSSGEFDLLYDKRDVSVGENYVDFMNEIDNCDSAIVILTPKYHEKIEKEIHSGALYEFNKIYSKYERATKTSSKENKVIFNILPVIFTGQKEEVTPRIISQIHSINLQNILFTGKNKDVIRKDVRNSIEGNIKIIIDKIRGSIIPITAKFQKNTNKYFVKFFKETKSDWSNPENGKYIDNLFVKTCVFRNIKNESAKFIVGRKGSGKSTLADILPQIDKSQYAATVQIEANKIPIVSIYSLFISNSSFESDTKHIFNKEKLLQFGWETFLYLSTLHSIININRINCVTTYNSTAVRNIRNFINEILNRKKYDNKPDDIYILFSHAFGGLSDFINTCIINTRPDYFNADMTSNFQFENYLNKKIPEKVIKGFNLILDNIESNSKRILLTLDGFDTTFDQFRDVYANNEEERTAKIDFEITWLKSFLHLILDKKHKLFSIFKYCITIPKDRYLEIREMDRDSYIYRGMAYPLRWSGIELCILLRKRLEELSSYRTDKNKNPEERFDEILNQKYSDMPKEIIIDFHGKVFTMELFFYVLTHTFWRPRDILYYYSHIIALIEETKSKKRKCSSEELIGVIKQASVSMIKQEFIREFRSIYENIDNVILSFKKHNQILQYEELCSILHPLVIKSQSNSISLDQWNINKKIECLYLIGFIGVEINANLQKRFGIKNSKYLFNFSEGFQNVKELLMDEEDIKNIKYVIHPAFCRYLEIDTSANQEFVQKYTWEHLHNQEIQRNIDFEL